MFVRCARFDKFEEEKLAVRNTVQYPDSWFEADLERIDLIYLEDILQICRKHADELIKLYELDE